MAKEKKKKPEAETAAEEKQTAETAANAEAEEQTEKEAPAETEKPDETAALKKQLDEANDKLLRTVAEYDNFRKRSQKEKEAIYTDSKVDIIGKLLPVIDNFERASAADAGAEDYKKGIEMTVKQLLDVFTSLGVEAYGKAGDEFDPNIHNGVMHVDDDELGENVITDVFMKGYKVGEKVIRHATVKVAN